MGALSDVSAKPVCTSQNDLVFAQIHACTHVHPRLTVCMPPSSVCVWPPSSMPRTHTGFHQHCSSAHPLSHAPPRAHARPPLTPHPPTITPGSRASCSWAWRCASQHAALASSSASQAKTSQNVLFAVAVCSKYTCALTPQNFRIFPPRTFCSPALAAALIREGQYSELCAGLAAGSTVQILTSQYMQVE